MAASNLSNGASKYENAVGKVQYLGQNIEALRAGNEAVRDAVIAECFEIISALESPSETFTRTMWTYTNYPIILKLACEMRLFHWLKEGGGEPLSSAQIASSSDVDIKLTSKLLKALASFNVIREVGVDRFEPTALSDELAQETYQQALGMFVPYVLETKLKVPDFFRENGYRMPPNALNTPVQYANNVQGKMHFFEIAKRDGQMQGLESFMKLWLQARPHWSNVERGFYPVRERLLTGAEVGKGEDGAFLVDIGGGQGQDFPRLFANLPLEEIPGRLILQDQPHVLAGIGEQSLPSRVEKMAYDFFTPQPIKGARAYLMHSIIHNHSDEDARRILKQVADAMTRGYSRLIIWDHVMPDQGADFKACALDFEMLCFYGTSERTEAEWKRLIEDAGLGLKITSVIRARGNDQDVIEVELE